MVYGGCCKILLFFAYFFVASRAGGELGEVGDGSWLFSSSPGQDPSSSFPPMFPQGKKKNRKNKNKNLVGD